MNPLSLCDISIWIDTVDSTLQEVSSTSTPPVGSRAHDDKEIPRQVSRSKRRLEDDNDLEETPRPSKRQRDTTQLPLGGPRLSPSHSPTRSNNTSEASLESHQSGRLSPFGQLQALEDDDDQPVFFCNFGDTEEHEERGDVATMRDAIQRLADGFGILGYEDQHTVTASLSSTLDRRRFEYPLANDRTQRLLYGAMPSIARLEDIVRAGCNNDRGTGTLEDDWNYDVQQPLIKLALETCKHKATLNLYGVKSLTIDPKSLARTREGIPRRIIDYVVALKPDQTTTQAWRALQPLLSHDGRKPIKSWNHVTRNRNLRAEPIAINVETKGPHKSWTDGKPQIAIWTDAWLNRLALLPRAKDKTEPWPAIPLLIAQGHDWHFLVMARDGEKTVIWDKIDVGSTRSCFDAMKVVAVLHWCMDWAETVWRPWFLSLL